MMGVRVMPRELKPTFHSTLVCDLVIGHTDLGIIWAHRFIIWWILVQHMKIGQHNLVVMLQKQMLHLTLICGIPSWIIHEHNTRRPVMVDTCTMCQEDHSKSVEVLLRK